MKKRYYAAYGSNLNIRQMAYRCPGAKVVGTSEIADYQLLFKGSKTGSYLTIEPKKGASVPVAVWEVTAADEHALDLYEGCPQFYYKAQIALPVADIYSGFETERRCFVYIMHEERPLGMPTWNYIDACLEGYDAFGFDAGCINEALKISAEGIGNGKEQHEF